MAFDELMKTVNEGKIPEMPILRRQLSEALEKGALLDPGVIPEDIQNLSVNNLDIPVRVVYLMEMIGVKTIWDLVHLKEDDLLKYRSFASSSVRLSELIQTINLAINVLTGEHL